MLKNKNEQVDKDPILVFESNSSTIDGLSIFFNLLLSNRQSLIHC